MLKNVKLKTTYLLKVLHENSSKMHLNSSFKVYQKSIKIHLRSSKFSMIILNMCDIHINQIIINFFKT